MLDGFRQDLRYGLRMMRVSLGFTTAIVLSLALGIGANTAIFSLLYTLMLHKLPVEHPERLVEFLSQYPGDPPLNVSRWRCIVPPATFFRCSGCNQASGG